jgi:predicted DsbA family dithiol-disulfide isomerase
VLFEKGYCIPYLLSLLWTAQSSLYKLPSYYFVEGHALNDKPRLAKVAAETLAETLSKTQNNNAHMTEDEVLTFLNGNEGRLEIQNALRALNELGVHGIPKFIIEGSYIVDGAAMPDAFIRIFRGIEKRGEIARGPVFGDILGVDESIVMRASHTKDTIFA